LKFSGGIKNENNETVFTGVKGTIAFIEPESGKQVLSLPFSLPVILPFDTGVIDIKKEYSEQEITPLIALLGLNKTELIKEKSTSSMFIDEKKVKIATLDYTKKNIISIIKEKVK